MDNKNNHTNSNSPDKGQIISDLQNEIEKIWKRARINSFAHRNANEEYYRKDSKLYRYTILTSLFSIFFIILSNIKDFEKYEILNFISLQTLLSLISIFFGFWSLIYTIFSNHFRYGILSEEHKNTQNSYLYIAQRTRLSKKTFITDIELLNIYEDLERDFSLVKVRGNEPTDEQFDKANILFEKISKNKTSSEAQSFNLIKENDKIATEEE